MEIWGWQKSETSNTNKNQHLSHCEPDVGWDCWCIPGMTLPRWRLWWNGGVLLIIRRSRKDFGLRPLRFFQCCPKIEFWGVGSTSRTMNTCRNPSATPCNPHAQVWFSWISFRATPWPSWWASPARPLSELLWNVEKKEILHNKFCCSSLTFWTWRGSKENIYVRWCV